MRVKELGGNRVILLLDACLREGNPAGVLGTLDQTPGQSGITPTPASLCPVPLLKGSSALTLGGHLLFFVCGQKCFGLCCAFFFFFLINLFYSFIYFWLCWVFIAAHGLSLVAASGGYSSLWCAGFSLLWLLLLRSTGSRHVGFSSCGTWAQELWLTGSRAQAQ